jgi:hypothetical protein
MLSAIIASRESERSLVPTLAALVPGAVAGLVREVIVADANSRDATADVAEWAGCRLVRSGEPLGARLSAAAASARAPWLLFMPAGFALDPAWMDDASRFVSRAGGGRAAAYFPVRPTFDGGRSKALAALVLLAEAARVRPAPAGALLIAANHYREIGCHRADVADPERNLARRLGRALTRLPSGGTLAGSQDT